MRIVYSLTRCWRFYLLFSFASVLTFFLYFISQHDPKLEHYFQYNFYLNGGANVEKIKKLMETNNLDYELLLTNAKFCFNNIDIDEDIALLDDEQTAGRTPSGNKFKIDLILLIISQANSLRNRNVIRQTWSKQLSSNTRFVFVVGNPAFNSSSQLDRQIQTRLKEESQKFNDIIQINMSDDESYLPTKTLIAIRWSLTYCAIASHLFILSDSAVLNVNLFHKKINLKDLENHTLVGACNYTDAKFASGLKLFFDGIPKKINKRESKDSKRPMNVSSSRSDRAASYYKGEYCSNLGWLISMQGAKQLWLAALRSTYIMKISPAFLNGYLAFKANLKHSDQFVYQDMVPMNTNCLRVLEENRMSMMACAENFTISNRYNSFISTWNSAPVFGLSKL